MREKHTSTLLILLFACLFGYRAQAQTSVEKIDGNWTLLVDGDPFEVKGVTFGYDKDVDNFDTYFEGLVFLGVNTIRIWATNEHTGKLLDTAEKNAIKVMIGIWMRHGRPGMEDDDSFDYLHDTEGKEAMYQNAIEVVETYKNHPAVLTWAIGNEVYLNIATDTEKEAYSKLLERIAGTIKKIDPNRPITSVEAWTFGLDWWQKYVPSIDIYGLNSYGPGAGFLSRELEKRGIDKPYIVTEFGVTGEWDIEQTKNGIKVEPGDQQKYNAIATGYHEWIKDQPNCLGVYIFHYANGSDFISPWLFTHHNSMTRPQYWATREAYTGKKPVNKVPVISSFELPEGEMESGTWVPVVLETEDAEHEQLEMSFYYNQRTGSRKRRDQITKLEFRGNPTDGFEIRLPKEHGAIKVYVIVKDTYNNAGIASTSVVVLDEEARNRKYLVPKAELPFYVYKDGEHLPYAPSAYMGNHKAIEVDLRNKEHVHSGKSSIKISYKAFGDWYGVGFVDPANDWGDILGGYDLTGAKTFSFRARASRKNIKTTIGFGLIDGNKPYPDTNKKSIEITLGTKWKKYTIKTKGLDLSNIRSGLVLVSSSTTLPHDIYLDEVFFE